MSTKRNDDLVVELFEHAYFMHGYLIGALMAAGRTGPQAWAETAPMRANVKRMADEAGLPVPSYFDAEEGAEPLSERLFIAAPDRLGDPPSKQVVSSAVVERRGAHDHVRIWNRGGLAGELVLQAGDGELLARYLGLEAYP